MSDMAKKARDAMKGKARKLAGEKDQKVDSSDWSPAEPLNAEVKTGMRPISRRAYKSGGKVEGASGPKNLGRPQRKAGGKAEEKAEAAEYAKAKINRDAKAANQEREGIKHVGGLKSGGRAKKQNGGENSAPPSGIRGRIRDMLKKVHPGDAAVQREQLRDVGSSQTSNISAEDRARMEQMANESGMKKGGRAKRKDGGKIATTLAGQEKIQREQAAASKPTRGKAQHYKKGGRAEKMAGGPMGDPRMNIVKPKAMEFSGAQGTPYKKGGRTEKLGGGALMGGILPALAMGEKLGKEKDEGKKSGGRIARKAGRPTKFYGGEVDGMGGDDRPETRFGGGRFGGFGGMGKPAGMMGGMGNAPVGQQVSMPMGGGRGMGPSSFTGMGKPAGMMGGAMPAMPQQQTLGGGMQQQMVGGMGKPAGMMGGMARKTGGRVARQDGGMTKKAKSKAKGKTNINIVIATGQPDGQGMMPPPGGPPMPPPGVPVPLPAGGGAMPAPPMGGAPMPMPTPMPTPPMARKTGGRTVAKSYKDMTAGAGSGEGRLQKTEIAEGKREARKAGGKVYRSYKDMDAGAGSGLGRLEKSEIQSRKG